MMHAFQEGNDLFKALIYKSNAKLLYNERNEEELKALKKWPSLVSTRSSVNKQIQRALVRGFLIELLSWRADKSVTH